MGTDIGLQTYPLKTKGAKNQIKRYVGIVLNGLSLMCLKWTWSHERHVAEWLVHFADVPRSQVQIPLGPRLKNSHCSVFTQPVNGYRTIVGEGSGSKILLGTVFHTP